MVNIIKKTKITVISWGVSTIFSASLISLGFSSDVSVFIGLVSFVTLYLLGLSYGDIWSFQSKLNIMPKTQLNSSYSNLTTLSPKYLIELKDRAEQLYCFHSEWSGKYSVKKIDSAYEQALLKVISKDHNSEVDRISDFSLYFNSYVDTFEKVHRKSNLTIDYVYIDLKRKNKRTILQNEFISFLVSNISELPKEKRTELELVYSFQENDLLVKNIFNNWFGLKIASFLGLLESQRSMLGVDDLLKLEDKISNNRRKS